MINHIQKSFYKLKNINYGLGFKNLNSASQKFGLSASWKSNIPFSKKIKSSVGFTFNSGIKYLREFVLLNSSKFNLGLKRSFSKHIRILKLNRSLRGVRHSQFLPVRGQRTKTNAKTQKLKHK